MRGKHYYSRIQCGPVKFYHNEGTGRFHSDALGMDSFLPRKSYLRSEFVSLQKTRASIKSKANDVFTDKLLTYLESSARDGMEEQLFAGVCFTIQHSQDFAGASMDV